MTGPKNIEIWFESKTGILLRLEFAGVHVQGHPSAKRLIITLIDQTPQSDEWFTHQAHHAPEAQVDFVPEE